MRGIHDPGLPPAFMDSKTTTGLAVIASCYCVLLIWQAFSKHRKLSAIPTIGPSGFLTSYIGALQFVKQGKDMIQEGYDKYRGSVFKVPMLTQWAIVVTNQQLIDDIRRASDDQLSLKDAAAEFFHTDILLDREMHDDSFHSDVVQNQLTRNIAARFSDVQDEITVAFSQIIPTKGNEWTTVNARNAVLSIVCRSVNRMLVGLPLCRNPDYISLNVEFTIDIILSGTILNLFPTSLRHFFVHFLRKVPNGIKRGMKHLGPLIRERIEQEAQNGDDWSDKPNDAISWLLEVAKDHPRRRDIKSLVTRMLLLNFVSIHTTTMAFTNALFNLATRPEYLQPMREEVEAVINEEGWTKSAIGKLRKLDSFLKESQRLSPGLFSVRRKVIKDFTFSNGVTVPAGFNIVIPHGCVHHDSEYYSDPEVFDGFRFSKMREKEGESTKHGMVTPTTGFLTFGQGRHACPGRFFAVNEVKTMLAYVLLNYDVKMANDGGRPSEVWFGTMATLDPKAEVMFRKRT
ncbi:cytochrome P450 [Amanita rubescens]|nr:cytochrome P450 [Amanita rubescens]